MSQPRIAAVLIVKNEGENLRACLQSVAGWVDEIVILDSGSSDNTAEIAAEFKANYQVEPHWPGYGRQRQLAQALVTAQWCFWLDADERVTDELAAQIRGAIDKPPPAAPSGWRARWRCGSSRATCACWACCTACTATPMWIW